MARGTEAFSYQAGTGDLELIAGTDFSRLKEVLNVSDADLASAIKAAARKAGKWAESESAKAMSAVTTIPVRDLKEAMRYRMKMPKKLAGAQVWLGLNDVSVKHMGAQQTENGVTTRLSRYPDAFVVHKLGSHVFQRRTKARLPIDKVTHSIVGTMEAALSRVAAQAGDKFADELFKQLDALLGLGSGGTRNALLA